MEIELGQVGRSNPPSLGLISIPSTLDRYLHKIIEYITFFPLLVFFSTLIQSTNKLNKFNRELTSHRLEWFLCLSVATKELLDDERR